MPDSIVQPPERSEGDVNLSPRRQSWSTQHIDATTAAINRSGKRRGATCVYLEAWHYDFEDFLELRKNTGIY